MQYTFTGEIPVGAMDTHSEIDIGETWVAFFFVDTSIPDVLDTDDERGFYPDAVINGSLTFSGGYVSSFDFSSFNVQVFDDVFAPSAPLVDAVQVESSNFFSRQLQPIFQH